MENAQILTAMLELTKKAMLDLCKIIKEADEKQIKKIFTEYHKIPLNQRSITKLRKKLKLISPYFFQDLLSYQNNKKISHKKQMQEKIKFFDKSETIYFLSNIDDFKNKLRLKTKTFIRELKTIFPPSKYHHSFRIKDSTAILDNIEKNKKIVLTDIIGIRIVPKHYLNITEILTKIECDLNDRIIFKLNTTASGDAKMMKKNRKHSKYYHAVHYYISIGGNIAEIQIRTPGIDQWSKIHHSTMYKEIIKVDKMTIKYIKQFGRIANIVDYYKIINNLP